MNLVRDNDEHWKDNLLGMTLDKRLSEAITQRHHREVLTEKVERQIAEIKSKSQEESAFEYNITESAFAAIINTKNKILDIGFNRSDDLILDNFGLWFGAHLRGGYQGIASQVSLVNDANVAKAIGVYGVQSYFFNRQAGSGTAFKAGSGTTTPAKNNYKIETDLGSAPENTYFASGVGSYGVGQGMINASNVLTAGGSGTVNEIGLFGRWEDTSGGLQWFMLFHDVLASGISYVGTNGIVIAYGLTI